MRTLTAADIDYSKRCDIPVQAEGLPPFVMQVHGYTAAELINDDGFAGEVVMSAMKRRGIPFASATFTIGEPVRVKLRGHSGRPR